MDRRLLALALLLPVLGGCATKRDLRDLRAEVGSMRTSQEDLLRGIQRQNEMILDSLNLQDTRLRGDLTNQMVQLERQLIQLQESGADISLQEPRLVQLSDRVAQTLWGRSGAVGVKGTRGSLVKPTFNIQDLDIFPSLDPKRLEELGLDPGARAESLAPEDFAALSAKLRSSA